MSSFYPYIPVPFFPFYRRYVLLSRYVSRPPNYLFVYLFLFSLLHSTFFRVFVYPFLLVSVSLDVRLLRSASLQILIPYCPDFRLTLPRYPSLLLFRNSSPSHQVFARFSVLHRPVRNAQFMFETLTIPQLHRGVGVSLPFFVFLLSHIHVFFF